MTRFCAPIEIHGRVEYKKPPVGCFASSGFVVLDGQGLSEASCECYQLVRSRLTFHIPKTRVIKSASHRMVMYFTDKFP